MTTLLLLLGGAIGTYGLLSLLLAYLAQQYPRRPVHDPPDWGQVTDARIPAPDGGSLEVWRIVPEGPARGVIVLAHGWGRNRDRMVRRARHFGRLGFTAVIHSARDHGRSSPRRLMNAVKMAEDIEAVLAWAGEPVLLYGHSAGAAAAIVAAQRHPEAVRLLFLESCYAETEEALLSLYRWFNRFFGMFFGPAIVFWMNLYYGFTLPAVSPARLAPAIRVPVLIIHGEKDRRFPLAFAEMLHHAFAPGRAELFVAAGAGHSESSLSPEYPAVVGSFIDRHLAPEAVVGPAA
ncbi:MAG: alpha/beta fold hydrolase [Desulfobacteraceae bacterium]|nr:MAG: alpha/beta fold hydrolase [Desulfobacteraceae bacterium]